MIPQDHRRVIAEAGNQPFTLSKVERNPLIVVIGQRTIKLKRGLSERQQSTFLRRYRHTGDGMGVQRTKQNSVRVCTALWIVNPAAFTENLESMTISPSVSSLTKLDAVISSNISPYGLSKK